MGHNFLEDSKGNKSSGRLIPLIIVLNAVAMAWVLLFSGLRHPDQITYYMQLVTAIGVLFASIGGSALIALFGNKRTETKTEVSIETQQ